MIEAGEIDEQSVVNALTDAALSVGLNAGEIGTATKGTIGSGFRNGRLVA